MDATLAGWPANLPVIDELNPQWLKRIEFLDWQKSPLGSPVRAVGSEKDMESLSAVPLARLDLPNRVIYLQIYESFSNAGERSFFAVSFATFNLNINAFSESLNASSRKK